MARRGLATGIVVLVAVGAGAAGGLYLWKEAFPPDTSASDAGIADASRDGRAAKGKKSAKKPGKRGPARPGKPHANRPAPAPGSTTPTPDDPEDNTGDDDDDTPEFQPPFRGRGPAGPTYEAAIASNNQQITMGGKNDPDLTDAQIRGPMQNGSFVGECGAPDSMKVTVKVAIKLGRPAGVSVSTSPFDPDIAGCIDRYVRTFSWPSSSKMDSFTTTY